MLMRIWTDIQPEIAGALFDYYRKMRIELGYETKINKDYPKVDSVDEFLKMIELVCVTVPYGGIYEKPAAGFGFGCTWNEEDGLGVLIIDGKIAEVGYQDVIF